MKSLRIVLLTIVAVILLTYPVNALEEAGIGDPCPKITLNDVKTGQEASVNEISMDKVTVIVLMQTSSAASTKYLDQLKSILSIEPDLNVIAISVDAGSTAMILKYIEHYKFPFKFLQDPGFTTPEKFGFSYTPRIIFLDRIGKIISLKGDYLCNGEERTLLEIVQDAFAK